MRSLVVYHSPDRRAERIARAVGAGLCERGESRVVAADDAQASDLGAAQVVVLGVPTQQWGISLPMWRFLRRTRREPWFARPVAVFETRDDDSRPRGSSADVLLARLRKMGALVVAPPETFFVGPTGAPIADEAVRAELWGRELHVSDRIAADAE